MATRMTAQAHRWMKFWPADWRQEASLKLCSRAARSLWIDLMCLAHEAQPYGHVKLGDKTLGAREIAAILGDRSEDVEQWLAELVEAGVCSVTKAGTIYSRRMVRDAAAAEKGRKAIAKRWPQDTKNIEKIATPISPPTSPPDSLDTEAEYRDRVPPPSEGVQGEQTPAPRPSPAGDADGPKRSSGTRLPEGWRPSEEGIAFCREKGLKPRPVWEAFTDYWRAQPGRHGRKSDWEATWRNWCRKEAETPHKATKAEQPDLLPNRERV